MYEQYFKELKTRSLDQKGPVQFVLTFPKVKHKSSKKVKKETSGSIQLSQDHRFGFIGLESQEKEMKARKVTMVRENVLKWESGRAEERNGASVRGREML